MVLCLFVGVFDRKISIIQVGRVMIFDQMTFNFIGALLELGWTNNNNNYNNNNKKSILKLGMKATSRLFHLDCSLIASQSFVQSKAISRTLRKCWSLSWKHRVSLQRINMPITWCNASSKGDGCKIRYGLSKLGPDFKWGFLPRKLTWLAGKPTIWRYICYWNLLTFLCHVSFRGWCGHAPGSYIGPTGGTSHEKTAPKTIDHHGW